MLENERLPYLREKTLKLPSDPGVYRMRDKKGEIIYIGKAKNLKNRVTSYFRSVENHLPKVYKMVENVWDFDYIVTDSEYEALILECSLIKQHTPKYNILLKDDKGYHYIRIGTGDYPRITAVFKKEDDGATYIGPYMSAMVVRETVDEVNKIFMLPTCTRVFPRDIRKGRPCLNLHIKQCMGVCTGKISPAAYKEILDEAESFIRTGGEDFIPMLTEKMNEAAENLNFEKAARYRDRIIAINKVKEQQKVINYNHKSLDVIAAVESGEKVYIAVLLFRDGRLTDKRNFNFERFISTENTVEEFIKEYYRRDENIPKEIYLQHEPADREIFEEMLTNIRGSKVIITVPKRGTGEKLLEMAENNAAQELVRKTRHTGKEIVACDALGRLLGIKTPEYIESYDISNFGSDTIVAGMVVFKNGRPYRKNYKRFIVKDFIKPDDYAAMEQVLTRRFMRYLDPEEKDEGFKTLPSLILLDGGAGHVNVGKRVLANLGLNIPLFGMVKDSKHRTRAITEENQEIAISPNKNVFSFVTNIQDEVHRYSIEYSRKKHISTGLSSLLLSIEGIGETRMEALYNRFKTIKAIKEASLEELCSVKGMTKASAQKVYDYFRQNS